MTTPNTSPGMSRRRFLGSALATTTAFNIVPSRLLGRDAPSTKLNIAGIGIGGMGARNMRNCENENIVALCDVDSKYAAETFKRYPKAKIYKDYRVMLDRQKDIDAVVIGTPDHTHAVITMAAMQTGKHVYCQKPLTHTVEEARTIREAAKRYGVQTQMGNQGRSSEHMRALKEWIDDGAIGHVNEVHAWSLRPAVGAAWSKCTQRTRPAATPPVPEHLNWDLWLGPAASRPYHPAYHPQTWRNWYDFGTGALGDMGCHILDPAFYALDLGPPATIEATCTHRDAEESRETYPRASIVRYTFPARGTKPPVKVIWYDGGLRPPRPPNLEPNRKLPADGAVLYGKNGCIKHGSHGASGLRIIPETRMRTYEPPPKTIPRVTQGHEGDWIRACKEGRNATPPCSDFDYACPLTELVLLGVIAVRLPHQRLEWDAETRKFTNSSAANDLLSIDSRAGYKM